MKRLYFLILSALFLSEIGLAQNTELPTFITDSLDKYIEQSLKDWNVPATAVGIVKDGKIIYQKAFGVKDIQSNETVDENTLFMIGSNTKAFTGTSLAMLEYQGKCSLNDKVIKWLPQFKLKDSAWTKQANLVDLLSHRMGFETFQGDLLSFDSDLSEDEYIEKNGKITPLYDFRTKWGYSNAGFMMAGKCIESISGSSWEDYFRTNILKPLKMDHTVITVSEIREAQNATIAHSIVDNKLAIIDYGGLDLVGPAASISSSISDMNKWTLALLNPENGVVPNQAIQRTRKPESIKGFGRHAYNKSNYNLYGLGWELSDYESKKLVSHTGGVHGYLTSVTLIPEENLAVVVLTNTDQNWLFVALKWEIVDAFLKLPYRNYSETWSKAFKQNSARDSAILAVLKDSVKLELKPEISLAQFAGKFKNEVYGYAELVVENDHLKLSLEHHPDGKGRLDYIGNHRFLCLYTDPTFGTKVFPFSYDENKVKSFTLSVNDFWEFTSYEFHKVSQ
ncbi:MAG: serine hydrolase [Salinivirgaceae bacterium]|nr:serine hydrolase [Salinivirgaceae bacterium]